MQTLSQIIPWVSLVISIYALYHAVKKDRLLGKIDKIHRSADLQKKLSELRLSEIPNYMKLLSCSEEKCKSCPSYCANDFAMINEFLTEYNSWADRVINEIRKPKKSQNRLRIEEAMMKIEICNAFFEYLKGNIKEKVDCAANKLEANQ